MAFKRPLMIIVHALDDILLAHDTLQFYFLATIYSVVPVRMNYSKVHITAKGVKNGPKHNAQEYNRKDRIC